MKRAVLRVASPAEEEHAHTDAVGERRVVCFAEEHGMATVTAYLSAQDAATVTAALDAVAYATIHGQGGDGRTADQRRADALVMVCSGVLADPHLVKAHGQRPSIQVTIAASTLMGLDAPTRRTGRVRRDHRRHGSAHRRRPHRPMAGPVH